MAAETLAAANPSLSWSRTPKILHNSNPPQKLHIYPWEWSEHICWRNLPRKPIKVGEKNHERQEHNSAGNFRQICSTSEEIRFLLILNSFLCMVFFVGFRTQRSNVRRWIHSKRTSDEGDMDRGRSSCSRYRKIGKLPEKKINFKNSPRADPAQKNSQIWPRCSWTHNIPISSFTCLVSTIKISEFLDLV